jgi:hypothetical protein
MANILTYLRIENFGRIFFDENPCREVIKCSNMNGVDSYSKD